MVDGFVSERPVSYMVPIITIMDLLHYPPSFLRIESSHVWVGVQFGIKLFIQDVSQEYVSGDEMLQPLGFGLVVGECPIFEIGYDRSPQPRRSIQMQYFLVRLVDTWL